MWLIVGFVELQSARGSYPLVIQSFKPRKLVHPRLFGFSLILSGTSIELFQNCNLLSKSPGLEAGADDEEG